VQLQETRHVADYDHSASFVRAEALKIIADVDQAFAAWHSVRNQPNATVFLAALMLQRQWGR
jgi:F0F1-type ATP synthase assembly protein I